MDKCTAVLLNWRRPANLPAIIDSLACHEFIAECLVWDNSGNLCYESKANPACQDSHNKGVSTQSASKPPESNSGNLDVGDDGFVRVIRSDRNRGTYGRFLAARMARCDVILSQDDDYTVQNWESLYGRFLGHRERIVAGLSPNHYRVEANRAPYVQLGWGSVWLREWVSVLDAWIERYGEDELLESKADRIFTVLHGKHEAVPGQYTALKGPDGRPSERDASSLWLQKDHYRLRDLAVQRALALKRETECSASS